MKQEILFAILEISIGDGTKQPNDPFVVTCARRKVVAGRIPEKKDALDRDPRLIRAIQESFRARALPILPFSTGKFNCPVDIIAARGTLVPYLTGTSASP